MTLLVAEGEEKALAEPGFDAVAAEGEKALLLLLEGLVLTLLVAAVRRRRCCSCCRAWF